MPKTKFESKAPKMPARIFDTTPGKKTIKTKDPKAKCKKIRTKKEFTQEQIGFDQAKLSQSVKKNAATTEKLTDINAFIKFSSSVIARKETELKRKEASLKEGKKKLSELHEMKDKLLITKANRTTNINRKTAKIKTQRKAVAKAEVKLRKCK